MHIASKPKLVTVLLALVSSAIGQQLTDSRVAAGPQALQPAPASRPVTMDQVVGRVVEREHSLLKLLEDRNPVVETYLQNLTVDPQLGPVPKDDRYFLGRLDLRHFVERKDYLKEKSRVRLLGSLAKLFTLRYQPLGFAWMIFVDCDDFDRQHYEFQYVRREFLGDVRTLVFNITPKKSAGSGRFRGRVWVEDEDFNIVRLNGTYTPAPSNSYFFHMDSWRLNLIPGYWLPAYVYSEEGNFNPGIKNQVAFKAQTRIWGYELKSRKDDELTQIRVDAVQDESPTAQDASPLESERMWQQQAEDNILERLASAGLLAPEGQVDKVLQTVVNNLEVTNNIDLPRPVRTRTLLTAPLETFSIGNTIVISRGLVDVLPDEASLAAVLSHELAHVLLRHNRRSQYAYNDRLFFADESTYQVLGFKHTPEEEAAADKKALELLKNSPYAPKLDNVGLFLRALQTRAPQLRALLSTHLGNPLGKNGSVNRLAELAGQGPGLDMNKLDQIAALPLGGRIKINPLDDRVEMVKTSPVAITSASDKMPFEVTPLLPHLTRIDTGAPAGRGISSKAGE